MAAAAGAGAGAGVSPAGQAQSRWGALRLPRQHAAAALHVGAGRGGSCGRPHAWELGLRRMGPPAQRAACPHMSLICSSHCVLNLHTLGVLPAGTATAVRVLHAKLASDLATMPILNPSDTKTQARQGCQLQCFPHQPADTGAPAAPNQPLPVLVCSLLLCSLVLPACPLPLLPAPLPPAGGGAGPGPVAHAARPLVAAGRGAGRLQRGRQEGQGRRRPRHRQPHHHQPAGRQVRPLAAAQGAGCTGRRPPERSGGACRHAWPRGVQPA